MPKDIKKVKEDDEKTPGKDLIEKLKSESQKEEEEDSEEEDSKDKKEEQKIPDPNFQITSIPLEKGETPTLEKIAGEQPGESFIPRSSIATSRRTTSEDNEENSVDYTTNAKRKNEPKYSDSSSQIYNRETSIDTEKLGRTQDRFSDKDSEALFDNKTYKINSESQSRERVWETGRVDTERLGREKPNPFDNTEKIKYEDYKPR